MAVELWGLHDRPILAKNLSLWKLIIELDAEPMVTILTSHDTLYDSSHPWSSLISLLQSFEVTRIHHIFRKRNHCVDFLANKWPLSNDSFILYSQLLFSIMYFLFSDAMGFSYPKTLHFVVLFNYITFYPKKKKLDWMGKGKSLFGVCLGRSNVQCGGGHGSKGGGEVFLNRTLVVIDPLKSSASLLIGHPYCQTQTGVIHFGC